MKNKTDVIAKLKIDVIFKKFFTDKNNIDILKHFIAAVLNLDYEGITGISIENSEIMPEDINGKVSRFDINLSTNERNIIIEMQMVNVGYFQDRTLYYWSRKFGGQLISGESYAKLKPTISINIMDFNLFDTEDYHSVYTVADMQHNKVLTDKCEIHYFELPKVSDIVDKEDKARLWLQLIKAESEGDLDMLTQTKVPEIMDGADVVRYFSEDEQMKFLALEREKALRDYISSQEYYREKGLAEGREKGLAEGRAKGLAEGRAKGLAEGRAEGEAKGIIQTYHELGKSFSDTVARIVSMYNMTESDAKKKVEQYWN